MTLLELLNVIPPRVDVVTYYQGNGYNMSSSKGAIHYFGRTMPEMLRTTVVKVTAEEWKEIHITVE